MFVGVESFTNTIFNAFTNCLSSKKVDLVKTKTNSFNPVKYFTD